jgi:hypothetical protein
VRVNNTRLIPEKYIGPIIALLQDYGYPKEDVKQSDIATASKAKTFTIRKDVIGEMDGFIFRRVSLPDGRYSIEPLQE